jgi:hypothetical protein
LALAEGSCIQDHGPGTGYNLGVVHRTICALENFQKAICKQWHAYLHSASFTFATATSRLLVWTPRVCSLACGTGDWATWDISLEPGQSRRHFRCKYFVVLLWMAQYAVVLPFRNTMTQIDINSERQRDVPRSFVL